MTKDKKRKIFSLALTAVLSVIGTLACIPLVYVAFPDFVRWYIYFLIFLGFPFFQ